MRRALAVIWLAAVLMAGTHVAWVAWHGLPLQTDLMALLPREDRDPQIQRAKDRIAETVSQRVVILVGHPRAASARAGAAALQTALLQSGLILPASDIPAADALKRLGTLAFRHRAGLLSLTDRAKLMGGEAQAIMDRAMAQIYGFAGMADGRLLAHDPFLLFPAFLADLPVPAHRLSLDQGWPSITEDGITWVAVTGVLAEPATALAFQRRFIAGFAAAENAAQAAAPGLQLRRLGTLFYAQAGAARAMAESSTIGLISLVGCIGLIVLAFRAVTPLVLGITALAIGMLAALSACLALFGQLHVAAQLFGASLIGVAVDYALLYFGQMFSPDAAPRHRLAKILPGLTLGMATTAIGYGTLALSPFPGLHQVAVFSAVGLVASFLTVVLWFPLLDRTPSISLPPLPRRLAAGLWSFWGEPRFARHRVAAVALLVVAAGLGLMRLQVEDDVRRQQALDPTLAAEQADIQRLTGFGQTSQFFVVAGADREQVLRREEALGDRLAGLVAKGILAGWQSPARFVPSVERQNSNRALVADKLVGPHLAAYDAGLGMTRAAPDPDAGPLTLDDITATGALPLLPALMIEDGLHMVTLDGLKDVAQLRAAAHGLDGVRFVDPTGDLGDLLGAYRRRAVALLAISAVLMVPLLALRYGLRHAIRVMVPPVAAIAMAPPLLALLGQPFTFFSAMALVLALSIGTDYAVFCAEDRGRRDPVTLFSVGLALSTTLLSFGLLAFSQMAAMRSFGLTMLAAVALAFLLAPMAGRVRSKPQ